MKCTWVNYLQPEDSDELEAVPCNRTAVVVYSKTNSDRSPDTPATLVYPRCSRHNTVAAQAIAIEQGYTREEVNE